MFVSRAALRVRPCSRPKLPSSSLGAHVVPLKALQQQQQQQLKGPICMQCSRYTTAVNGISYEVYLHKSKGGDAPPPPKRDALFMHGILGSKRNWRTPAKLLTQLSPELRVTTMDHRGHGMSHDMPGENTLEAAAADVRGIMQGDQNMTAQKLQLLAGHSFGGKVALIYLQQLYNDPARPTLPKDTWILDCLPGVFDGTAAISENTAEPNYGSGTAKGTEDIREANSVMNKESVGGIFHILSELPEYFGDPKQVQRTLQELGVTLPVAQWLTSECRTNANSDTITRNNPTAAANYQLGFDLHVATELFADFCITDLWTFIESFDGRGRGYGGSDAKIHFVRAGRNPLWKLGSTLDRFERLSSGGGGSSTGSVKLHTMSAVGHWLHVEDARGLMQLIKQESALQGPEQVQQQEQGPVT